jgi:pilus assembly protein Flp/PilA
MKNILERTYQFFLCEDGPTVTEYAVMIGLIVLVCIAAILGIGQFGERTFTTIDSTVPSGPES